MEAIKEYSKIVLSLDNCIVPKERLLNTPSRQDGVSCELEVKLRLLGCECIQTAGLLLKLPQVAMASAQVIFQRFYYSKSFIKYSLQPMAMACIFLAAKIEEDCRRIRDVINVFHHLRQKLLGKTVSCMEYMGEDYFKLKSTVIKYERFLLKELGFCVHIKHSHKLIITYLQMLEMDKNAALAQRSWNYMNDSLRTNVFVRFTPETIACACIYLGARQLKIPLPQSPPWWLLFDADFEDMEAIALELLALYRCARVKMEDVEKEIGILKEEYQKKQVAIKEVKIKKQPEIVDDPSNRKGLLPTPGTTANDTTTSSLKVSPSSLPTLPKPSSHPISPPPLSSSSSSSKPRPIPKSYQMSSPLSSPPRPSPSLAGKKDLRIPSSNRSSRSVSPLVTHVRSARDHTPPRIMKDVPSPIRWQEEEEEEEEEEEREEMSDGSSDSRTPSPLERSRTPPSYRPVISPIILSEDNSDSVGVGSPSPLSLVRRENGLLERPREEMYDRKPLRSRHRHSDHGNHREHRGERKRLRSHSNDDGMQRHRHHHRDHTHRNSKHRHKAERRERRERLEYPHHPPPPPERRHRGGARGERERERDYEYEQRSRKVDRLRR